MNKMGIVLKQSLYCCTSSTSACVVQVTINYVLMFTCELSINKISLSNVYKTEGDTRITSTTYMHIG